MAGEAGDGTGAGDERGRDLGRTGFSYATPGNADGATDGRLYPPTYERNAVPIGEALARVLGGAQGMVIEIGAGTGRHATHYAEVLPGLVWQPTDPQPEHRASIAAWVAHAARANLRPPLAIDVLTDWTGDPALTRAIATDGPVGAIFAQNVVHIAPWSVTEALFAGAARLLAPTGALILYGPFRQGATMTPGNAAFDLDLRRRDPSWGLRDRLDLDALAGTLGFAPAEVLAMPANNHVLVWRRA
ncbi:MAG: DUF938 domain-containing protein [Pseudomonadota bacterium]